MICLWGTRNKGNAIVIVFFCVTLCESMDTTQKILLESKKEEISMNRIQMSEW